VGTSDSFPEDNCCALAGVAGKRWQSAAVHAQGAMQTQRPHWPPNANPGWTTERATMKKLVLAAAILLIGAASAQAQRSSDSQRDGKRDTQSDSGSQKSGNRPATASKPVVVVKPAAAPVAPKRVFVEVARPSVPTWNRSEHPYAQRHHSSCQEKAFRLRSYERHAADDGYLSGRERSTISTLKRDLDRTCGRFRWR
jgi:hypothetical protein